MTTEFVIACGPDARLPRGAQGLKLVMGKGSHEVHLSIQAILKSLAANIDDVATDLIEVASYIYVADQACTRGGEAEFDYGDKWRRRLRFRIAVRCPDVWMSPSVNRALIETLGFLSDDHYELEFVKLKKPPPVSTYLEFGQGEASGIDEVMLFSGGLDSLGGAVQEVIEGRRRVMLVSHQSGTKLVPVQRKLANAIWKRTGEKKLQPLHLQVAINKGKPLGKEFTQRTRSFLYAAIAAVAAIAVGRRRVRFYENGVISLNLPISAQALGGRASRSTHPRVLAGFATLFAQLFGAPFEVENPFLSKTKTDVLLGIKAADHADLCAAAVSCAHTWERTTQHSHCGRCSQCIDRRLVAVAAGLSDTQDPPEMYAADVLRGPRSKADETTLIERYVGTVLKVSKIATGAEFGRAFGETARALKFVGANPTDAIERMFRLYARHSQQILGGLASQVAAVSTGIIAREIPPTSLLGITIGLSAHGQQPTTPELAGSTDGPPAAPEIIVDRRTFSVCCGPKKCELRNTMEFRLIEFLAGRASLNWTLAELRGAVWGGQQREKNTIQKTVSNLNRALRTRGIGVRADGTNRGHYRLVLQDGATIRIQQNPSDASSVR